MNVYGSITKSCYFQLRSLSKIRKHLTESAAKTLTHALVTSRLDTMNSLSYDLLDCLVSKLQLLQNNAARLIMRQRKSCHITPSLFYLHWLPIEFRIKYKILLIVYKCLHGEGPSYLSSLLREYCPPRSLRSSNQQMLVVPKTNRRYGDRAFSVAGPKLWNDLPDEIKNCDSADSFKRSLKTHFFRLAYM